MVCSVSITPTPPLAGNAGLFHGYEQQVLFLGVVAAVGKDADDHDDLLQMSRVDRVS